jgi:hypothetical protein
MVNIANDHDNAGRATTLAGTDPIPTRAGAAEQRGTAWNTAAPRRRHTRHRSVGDGPDRDRHSVPASRAPARARLRVPVGVFRQAVGSRPRHHTRELLAKRRQPHRQVPRQGGHRPVHLLRDHGAKAGETAEATRILYRFHLVMDVIDRVPGLVGKAAVLRQEMADKRAGHRAHVRRSGEDLPEIRDWAWTGTP